MFFCVKLPGGIQATAVHVLPETFLSVARDILFEEDRDHGVLAEIFFRALGPTASERPTWVFPDMRPNMLSDAIQQRSCIAIFVLHAAGRPRVQHERYEGLVVDGPIASRRQ